MLRYATFAEGYINDLTGLSYCKRVKQILENGGASGGIDTKKYWEE